MFISIAYNHYVVVYFLLIEFFDNHKKTHRVISGVKKNTFVSVSSSGLCFSISVTFSLSNVTRDSTHLSQTCLFADKSNVVNQSVFCYPPIFPKIFSVHDSQCLRSTIGINSIAITVKNHWSSAFIYQIIRYRQLKHLSNFKKDNRGQQRFHNDFQRFGFSLSSREEYYTITIL